MMDGVATLRDVEAVEAGWSEAGQPRSTYEAIARGAHIAPAAPALSFFLSADGHRSPETWSYAELLGRITQTANLFHRLGARKDTVIAFVLPNLPETHLVIWGGEAAGIVLALNPLLEGSTLEALLAASGAEILVTLAPFPKVDLWTKVQPALGRLPALRHLVLVNLADHVRGPKGVPARLLQRVEAIRLHGLRGVRAAVPPGIEVHDLGAAIRGEEARRLDSGRVFSGDDASSWFCTGGTTGKPKLAMRRHGNEVANAWSAAACLAGGVGPGKVFFCGLPLFHVNAVLVTGLLPFSRGAHVLLGTPQGYRGPGVIQRFWEIVEHHRVNFFSGVPTLYAALLDVPIGGRDVSCLEYGLCGAAPMPAEVHRTFEARTGIRILEGYGLTEATCVSSVNPPRGERRVGSVGLRMPAQEMKVARLDERGAFAGDCQVDEVGVVLVRGPNVFTGYRDPSQDADLWVDCGDGRPWLNTGDLARQDADGYFWLAGRKKDLIIRGGHNIDPAAIEEPLHRHPAVALAAAVGRPDARAGEVPAAYVQLRPGAAATGEELLAFLREAGVERAALPRRVQVIEALPLTPVGKIFKPALKRREVADALGEALRDAGIPVRSLDVDDGVRGMEARVVLDPAASPDEARAVLGRFAVSFTVS